MTQSSLDGDLAFVPGMPIDEQDTSYKNEYVQPPPPTSSLVHKLKSTPSVRMDVEKDPRHIKLAHETETPIIESDDSRLHQYALYGFAIEHFLLPPRTTSRFLSMLGRGNKTQSLETRLQWSMELLRLPLTKLNGEQAKIALQAFRNISGFMGNRSSGKRQIDHCFKLLRNVMVRATPIKDEIYCQLCKQLTNNPDQNATLNGWLLLQACLVSFPPSKDLMPFIQRFCFDHMSSPNQRTSQYAQECLTSLGEWGRKSVRAELPSLREIESLRDLTPIEIYANLIDLTSVSINVTSWTTVTEFSDMIATKLGIQRKQAFSLYEISPQKEERKLDGNERIVDLLALWERLGIEYAPKKIKTPNNSNKVFSKRNHEPTTPSSPTSRYQLMYKIFLYLPIDDDMLEDLELVYKQAVHDILHAIFFCSLNDCIQLAAYQLHCSNSHSITLTLSDLTHDIHQYVPLHLLSTTNRPQIAQKVLDAYHALDQHQPAPQLRRDYLRICNTIQLFGSTFFTVRNTRDDSMPSNLILALNCKGISLVNVENEALLHHFPYASIASWGYSSNSFVFVMPPLNTNDHDDKGMEYVFKTKMGKIINDTVAAYVAYLVMVSDGSE